MYSGIYSGIDSVQVEPAVPSDYEFYDALAKQWLIEWGNYHWTYRDSGRDELGYPRVSSNLYSGGGRAHADLPDMTSGAGMVESLYKRWSHERKVIAWVCWVAHANCSRQYQCSMLKAKCGVTIDRNRLAREVGAIVSAVATGVILNDD